MSTKRPTRSKRAARKKQAPARASIDRLEDDVAVLVGDDGKAFTRARAALPEGAREGDVVDLEAMRVDREATEALRADVKAARERAMRKKAAPGGDFEL